MMRASTAASMFPPLTMQTTRPSPASPRSAVARASAPAPSATTRARRASRRVAAATSSTGTANGCVDEPARAIPHRGQQRAAACAVDERRLELDLHGRACGERRCKWCSGRGLGRDHARLRPERLQRRSRSPSSSRRRPTARRPASKAGKSSTSSRPMVPLPAMTASSSTGCTNRPSTPS